MTLISGIHTVQHPGVRAQRFATRFGSEQDNVATNAAKIQIVQQDYRLWVGSLTSQNGIRVVE